MFYQNNKSKIDLLLKSKPMSFQVKNTTERGLNDCHKLISSFMKSYISRLKPKTIFYRNYKNFGEEKFVTDVKAADFSFSNNDPTENCSVLSDTFSKLVDRHAPLKMKIQRENHPPFVSKEMRKAIYARSRLRNKFCETLLRKMKENIKGNGIYVYLLGVRQLNNTFPHFSFFVSFVYFHSQKSYKN